MGIGKSRPIANRVPILCHCVCTIQCTQLINLIRRNFESLERFDYVKLYPAPGFPAALPSSFGRVVLALFLSEKPGFAHGFDPAYFLYGGGKPSIQRKESKYFLSVR